MNNKKRKKVAQQIFNLERIVQSSSDKQQKAKAEEELMSIPEKYGLSLVDMMEIDELVLDMLDIKK
jgi:hypothetical protein